MTEIEPYDRRGDDRRQIDIGPSPFTGERRHPVSAVVGREDTIGQRHDHDRRKQDRRVGERRQVNLGPPAGIEERRFRPDPRGVVFLYVDDI